MPNFGPENRTVNAAHVSNNCWPRVGPCSIRSLSYIRNGDAHYTLHAFICRRVTAIQNMQCILVIGWPVTHRDLSYGREMRAACRSYFQHRYLADRNMTTISTPLQKSSNDANKDNHINSKRHEPSVHSHCISWRQQVPHSPKTYNSTTNIART